MAKFCYLMTGIILLPLWCASCNDNNPRKEIQKIVKEWLKLCSGFMKMPVWR